VKRLALVLVLSCGGGPTEPPAAARCLDQVADTVDIWIDSTRYQEIVLRCRRWSK
jgi:hypothetical protein